MQFNSLIYSILQEKLKGRIKNLKNDFGPRDNAYLYLIDYV